MDESNVFEAFITKRRSFESDKELRAITFLPFKILEDRESDDSKGGLGMSSRFVEPAELTKRGKYVGTDLDILVEKIFVAPKSEPYFKEAVESLTKKFGLQKEIVKSELYSLR